MFAPLARLICTHLDPMGDLTRDTWTYGGFNQDTCACACLGLADTCGFSTGICLHAWHILPVHTWTHAFYTPFNQDVPGAVANLTGT